MIAKVKVTLPPLTGVAISPAIIRRQDGTTYQQKVNDQMRAMAEGDLVFFAIAAIHDDWHCELLERVPNETW